MGVGESRSRVDPETLLSDSSLPPTFLGYPFFKKQITISNRLMMSRENEASLNSAHHCSSHPTKKNDTLSEQDSTLAESSATTVVTNKDQVCHQSTRRRSLIPTASVNFRDNHCCTNPFNPPTSIPLEVDESQTSESPVILEDALGTVALPPFRQWQIFPGNNRFYCDGRLMTGPDRLTFYLSFGLLNLVFGLFSAFVIPYTEKVMMICIIVLTALLYFSCVTTMLYCALIDPGIVRRSSRAEVELCMKTHASAMHPNGVLPFIRETVDNSQRDVFRRWCPTCLFYKPPRATHCRICNNCVERFDHHCPFIGNCVGQRNYPTFVVFLISVTLSGIFISVVCTTDIFLNCHYSKNAMETLAKWETIVSICTGLLALISIIPIIVLLYMHIELIFQDLTTNEDLKRTYGNHNPFDSKSCLTNCKKVLCGPRLPSLINAREFVTHDWLASLEHSDAVQSALLKRFGRDPDSNENPSSQTFNTITNQENAPENWKASRDKGFVFLHHKSEPNISKRTGKNKENAATSENFSTIGTAGDFRQDVDENVPFSQYHKTFVSNQKMEALHPPQPEWYFVNLLAKKKRMLRTDASFMSDQYDLEISGGNRSVWKSKRRFGPTYQNHHV